ncbi:E3 SUMO-protein ligase KIAA1586-like [Diabrotica virgifera virgifera]|uniref:HAT C-terminal dimerisation domain-containing protein n=1 Tax=Diabrotica virgifera virgifera TaxID=50390 RepID=A0ABM5L1V7_DIAVI|nr:E3 SUMO-protein ligase KIAA1586-like [Diabrotica virgifera virgifera]
MEPSKKNQKTLFSFFSKQPNEDKGEEVNDFGVSLSGKNSTSLRVSSDEKSDLQAGTESNSSVSSSSNMHEHDEQNKSEWPSIWTIDMWERKKEAFPWLGCKNGSLGCTLCSTVSHLGAFKKERTSISKEWCTFAITFNGSSKSAQLTSLRKKIFLHKQSSAHLTAESITAKANEETIENVCDKMNVSNLESTIKVFRSAYYLAKNDRPFSDYSKLLQLQKMNGVDIGVGLHSRFSATEIIDHISHEMKKRITQQVKSISGKISILIDESTSLSDKSTLIVYLKCETSKDLPPNVLFLDLIELPNQTADSIFEALLGCLKKYGFDFEYLKENLVAFACDGASVMLGKKSGVVEKLLQQFPNIVPWHCMNHRIELAVSDSINDVGAINHFQMFMDKLYTLYSKSPKNQRELAECASELDLQLQKVDRILGTRWVSSSFKTVMAVWYGYQALYSHFKKAQEDKNRTTTERAMYGGLIRRLTSTQFLSDLAIMYDILAELTMVSECLQNREATVVYADKLIRRSIAFFECLKEKPGTKTLEAKRAAITGNFCHVPLTSSNKITAINDQQLLSSVINNLKRRLFTTRSSNEPSNKATGNNYDYEKEYESLLSELKVLESNNWPPEKYVGYGEQEIEHLCARFRLNANKIKNSFRDYLENSTTIPKDLNPLINCTKLIPCSSAECERGFSHMNIIISPTRSKLTIEHVSALMFIKLNGPSIQTWKPENYVKAWLRRHRTADDTRTRRANLQPDKEEEDAFAIYL